MWFHSLLSDRQPPLSIPKRATGLISPTSRNGIDPLCHRIPRGPPPLSGTKWTSGCGLITPLCLCITIAWASSSSNLMIHIHSLSTCLTESEVGYSSGHHSSLNNLPFPKSLISWIHLDFVRTHLDYTSFNDPLF